jgi:hypothetical protein
LKQVISKKKVSINIEVAKQSPIDKINIDFENGLINKQTKILYYLHSIFDKNRLPKKYKSTHPIKNVTNIIEEVKKYIGLKNNDRSIIKLAKKYFKYSIPNLEKKYISKSGYFRINYSLSGNNKVFLENNNKTDGVPSYIIDIGEAFDYVKEKTCDKAGFRKPIFENGKKYFDVYVYDLAGIYGMTFSSEFYKIKGLSTSVASSYICIDNNYSTLKGFDKKKLDCMRVTVAHEFFHSVQYAYNVNSDIWWKEASATWNEDEVYNSIDDYMRYLSSYFKSPHESLDTSSYGGVLFAKFLSENISPSIIKRIWEIESIINKTSVEAIDMAIKEMLKDDDIGTIFNKFTAYNFNPKQYYKEGDLWKVSPTFHNIHDEYPIDISENKLNHLSANYELFKASKKYGNKSLRIIFEGNSDIRWGVKIQKRKLNDLCDITIVPILKKYDRTQIIVNNFNQDYKEVCLIPANLEKEKDGAEYNYTARLE